MSYRLVYSDFWTDPKVVEEMSPEDKFFYLYILTNPSTTSCGIYMITKKQMAFELGHSIETVNTLMDRFEKHHKLIIYNKETRELAIKNWGKYNLSRGGKPVIDCLTSELSKVKDKSLIKYVNENVKSKVISELYRSFYDGEANRERQEPREVDNTYTDTTTITINNTITTTNTDTVNSDEHDICMSIIKEYEEITGKIGILNLPAVKIAILQYGQENVRKAFNAALEKGKLNMSYVNGILRVWERQGDLEGGESNANRSSFKNNGTGTNEFTGFKPQEPRSLTDEERKEIEDELI
jgi:DnaD/phage-associated family protein